MVQIIFTFFVAVIIIYLSYLCSKYIGKGANASRRSRYMRVIDQIPVGQDRHLAIAQIGIKYFLVGIASGQVNVLSELQEEDLIQIATPEKLSGGEFGNFKDTLEKWKTLGKRGK